jgi:hypothetical protein
VIKQVAIRTSCWRRWQEAATRARQTRSAEDVAEAWRLYCEAARFEDKMQDSERCVSYSVENT